MKKKTLLLRLLILVLILGAVGAHYLWDPWGYYHKVSPDEENAREQYIQAATAWLGINEADGSHKQLLRIYNAEEPLPQGYTVTDSDSWCAVFVSVSARKAGLAGFPMECSCGRQIELWQDLGRWVEDESEIPAPGDVIYYDWDEKRPGDSQGWPDHVGIVVGIKWPFVKVIEGNYDDRVQYRVLPLWDVRIRGYGKPDF